MEATALLVRELKLLDRKPLRLMKDADWTRLWAVHDELKARAARGDSDARTAVDWGLK